MPKKNKEIDDHLMDIKYLMARILLDRKPNVKEVAKIIGCSDNMLTELYPNKTKKKKEVENTETTNNVETITPEVQNG